MKMFKKIITMAGVLSLSAVLGLQTFAASSVKWMTHENCKSLVTFKSNTITIKESNGSQVPVFSFDDKLNAPKAAFSDNHFSFKMSCTDKGSNDWNALFAFRFSKPESACWDPTTNSIVVTVNKQHVVLTRKSAGNTVEKEVAEIKKNFADGKLHNYDIRILGKKVTLTVDSKYKAEITCNMIPSTGGYQFMAMKSDITISNFDNYSKSTK